MAKADDASSTTVWIWLSHALALVHEALGSREGAKKQLTKWLRTGALPAWDGLDGAKIDSEFWGRALIHWEDNWARDRTMRGTTRSGIRVSHAHLQALLPAGTVAHGEAVGSSASRVWVVAEATRMKEDGEIPQGIKITDFAKELERRMKAAAAVDRSIRAVGWGYIKNKLPEWGLWPISSIP